MNKYSTFLFDFELEFTHTRIIQKIIRCVDDGVVSLISCSINPERPEVGYLSVSFVQVVKLLCAVHCCRFPFRTKSYNHKDAKWKPWSISWKVNGYGSGFFGGIRVPNPEKRTPDYLSQGIRVRELKRS